jgi:predicted ester cyclase
MSERIERNKEVVRRLVERVINQWHIEELDQIFEEHGVEGARKDFTTFREAFPDWQMELKELVAEGDTVVARFKCNGTHMGRWGGDEPTNKRMTVDEIFFFRLEDGLISDMWALEDNWARKRQLGLL